MSGAPLTVQPQPPTELAEDVLQDADLCSPDEIPEHRAPRDAEVGRQSPPLNCPGFDHQSAVLGRIVCWFEVFLCSFSGRFGVVTAVGV